MVLPRMRMPLAFEICNAKKNENANREFLLKILCNVILGILSNYTKKEQMYVFQ